MNLYHFIKAGMQLLFAFTLVACNGSVSAEKAGCLDSAQKYWNQFRAAVMDSNVAKVADQAQFPFVISSGITDDTRKNKNITRNEFIEIYPQLLISDPGLTLQPSTMWDLIKENESLNENVCSAGDLQFRVGDWVFKKGKNGWKFIQAYYGEE